MRFSSEFECGNGKDFEPAGPMRWRMRLRADAPGYDHYFHFHMESEQEEGVVEIEVLPDERPAQAGPDLPESLPGLIWRRRGADGPWERVESPAFQAEPGRLTIRQAVRPGEAWHFSEAFPIPFSDMARHLEDMPSYCPVMKVLRFGETPEGRPLLGARVTDTEVPEAEKGRVFIIAGQHGVEFAGTFAAKGCLDFLASRLPQAAALRRQYIFDLLPCANPDGNAHGMGCFNSEGRDQLTAFAGAAVGAPCQTAEAALIWAHMERYQPDLILNFHAYSHRRPFGDPPFEGIYLSDPEWLADPARRDHQLALNHALFYLTPGGSQHRRPCPAAHDTLEMNVAAACNSLTALYQVQSEEGPHRNMLTGISVLQTVLDTLEYAQAEQDGL
jgi:hypothetical protein